MPAQPVQTVMERLLKRGKARFFVDTCFLLNPKAFKSLDNGIWDFLHSWNSPVVLPYPVAAELERHSKSADDPKLAETSSKVLAAVGKRQQAGHLRLLGSKEEKFADQVFLEVFTRFRPKYDLLLFTNDKGLCRDLLRLNSTESTSRCQNEIWVAWQDGSGVLAARGISDLMRPHGRPTRKRATNNQPRTKEPLFKPAAKPRVLDARAVGGDQRFKTGDVVKSGRGDSIRLGASVQAGGEGEIFEVDRDRVAKIYFTDRRTSWRADKVALMCGQEVSLKNVTWPTAPLLSSDGRFVGYIMPYVKGKPLQQTVFGKATIQESFPRWNRLNLVTLARTVADTVASLNEIGVLVGDINPMNFLVASDTDVQMVDVDSVQLGDFPCPVGMANFRAPEITEQSYEKFLRTEQHEAFALATMIFMILMGGKPPFSFQGGGDPAENIRKGNFPYVTDHGLIPAGAYRYIWSFFPYSVKKAFEAAFIGKDPAARPTAQRWVAILDRYRRDLEKTTETEPLAIWPTSFKQRNNKALVQLRCAECGSVFQTSTKDAEKRRKFPKILCGTCVTVLVLAKKAGENHTCKRCGKLFQVPFHEVQRHGDVLEVCQPCVAQIAAQPRRCKECSQVFTLEVGEAKFLLAKGLNLPKRCGPCRGKVSSPPSRRPSAPSTYTSYSPPPSRPQPAGREPSVWEMLRSFFFD